MFELAINAVIVSTGARTALVVRASRRDVTLTAQSETYALAPTEVERLRAAFGHGAAMRSRR